MKGIDTRNKDSQKMLAVWDKCEDCREGQTAIHEGGERYLPRLSGQTDKDYDAYKRRAVFYGAMSRTVDAFMGMIMRVAPVIDNGNPILDDVTGMDESLSEFIEDILEDALVTGFGGILVEHTPIALNGATVAQVQAAGARPYLIDYDAEDIINWKYAGKVLSQVILREEELIQKTEFESESIDFYRVLDLDESGNYRQRKFVKNENAYGENEFEQVGNDIYPLMNGANIREIPFYFIGCADELPSLIDLVDLNISHYMTTADLENGCHFTGIPQPWLSGVQLKDGESLSVGGVTAWVFPDPQAQAQYLEFSGQGLGALEKRLELKERQMAALGAKMLSDQVVAETATAAGLRMAGEFSVLAQLSDNISKVITRACTFMYTWAGLGAVNIALNKKFVSSEITMDDLIKLFQIRVGGGISEQTFFSALKKSEYIDDNVDFEQEQTRIAESMQLSVQQSQNSNAG